MLLKVQLAFRTRSALRPAAQALRVDGKELVILLPDLILWCLYLCPDINTCNKIIIIMGASATESSKEQIARELTLPAGHQAKAE
jgi:hypothetical protein